MTTGNTRERMVQATTELIRRRGLAATSFTDILSASQATRGVIYHHFPNGKDELVSAALRVYGEAVADQLQGLSERAQTPQDVIDAFLAQAREVVLQAVGGCSCAVAAAVTESAPGTTLHGDAAAALARWSEILSEQLSTAGLDGAEARRTAALLLALLEGSQVLCRAAGSVEPFDAAANALRGGGALSPG